jgi:hypothetical protein
LGLGLGLTSVVSCAENSASAIGGGTKSVAVDAKPYNRVPEGVLSALGEHLTLEAAFSLQSTHSSFGGLSGLWIDDKGDYAVMISDVGQRWQARLLHDDRGRLIGLEDWSVADLMRLPGEQQGSRWLDSEALSGDGNGHLVVAYEGHHRLRRWPIDDLDRVPEPLTLPKGLGSASNSGIEALSSLPGGRLFALAERVGAWGGEGLMGWVIDDGRADDLVYVPAPGFAPTGAGRLDDRIYVVERSFSLLGGFQNRIVALSANDVRPGVKLEGDELAAFKWDSLGENFEAIAAKRGADGRTRLYLLADDNFSFLQETLLVQLLLNGGGEASDGKKAAARRDKPLFRTSERTR